MRILAIESSCDDTAVAIVEDGWRVLVSKVASQEKIHARFGGVVPEVAAREHIQALYPLVDSVLRQAQLRPKDIDALAVTVGPGLLGSLMVGVNGASALAYLWKKPIIPVDHMKGHFYSAFLGEGRSPILPALALIVSGGHTELVLVRKHGDYQYLGGTIDDAAGEAFDKAARLLGLGYPGGPAISRAAGGGERVGSVVSLPRPMMDRKGLDMSFSGLKTALARQVGAYAKGQLAAEFQRAVVDVLVEKTMAAVKSLRPKSVILAGGVAANDFLRGELEQRLLAEGFPFFVAERKYCTDNAAMIGAAAYWEYRPGRKYEWYNAKVKI